MLGSEGLEAMPKGRGEQIQVQVSEAGDQFRFLQQQEKGKSWGKLGGSRPSQSGSRQQAGRQGWGLGQQVRGWAHRETSSCPESRAHTRQVSWVNALHLNSPGRS